MSFTGNLRGEMKRSAWVSADGFLLTAHTEGFSMGSIEAMAYRLPVLMTPWV